MTVVPRCATAGSVLAVAGLLLSACPLCAAQKAHAAKTKPAAAQASPQLVQPPLDDEIKAALKAAPSAKDYPNSDYATLLDVADVKVLPDGTVTGTHREAYKVFNERGRQLADVSLYYASSYQSVDLVYARTIKKNGTVVYVKPSEVHRTSVFAEYPLYDDSKAVKFSMPAVEDGCVIEYLSRRKTLAKLMPGQHAVNWGFTNYQPVQVSRLRMTLPAAIVPKYKVHNAANVEQTVTTSADGALKTYTWQMSKIPPVDPEPMMPEIKEFRPWMEVSSADSWGAVGKWFRDLQKPQAVATPAIRATVAKLTAGCKTDDEKAKALYDWVASKVRYVAVELGMSAFQPHKASEVYDKLYGDCKDKANLLITMLAEAGIKADPVLVPANEHLTLAEQLPAPRRFNHCIALAHVGGRDVWLDATADSCAYGAIPEADRGTSALVITDAGSELRTVPASKPGETGVSITRDLKLATDGAGDSRIVIEMTGMYGEGARAAYRRLTPELVQQASDGLAQALGAGSKLLSHRESDPKVNTDPFRMSFEVHTPALATKSGDLLIVPLRTPALSADASSLANEKRVLPLVSYYEMSMRATSTIALPEGYEVMSLPSEVSVSSALLDYTRTATRSADGRSVVVSSTGHYKPGRAAASDYTTVRAAFQAPAKADVEQLVLRKKQ